MAATATVAACGSDGGDGSAAGKTVSTQELSAKLQQEPDYKQFIELLSKGKTDAKTKQQVSKFTDCVADAVRKIAPDDKLRDYVDGKRTLKNIGDPAKLKAQQDDIKSCISANVPK